MKKNGFSPILIILVVGALLVGGYFFFSKSGSLPGLSSLPKVTEKDFANIEDPLVRKHFAAQANQHTFRTKTLSSGRGQESVSEFQLSASGFKMRTLTTENGKEVSEMINIDDTSYVKDYSDGKWWKQVAKKDDTQESETSDDAPTSVEDLKEEYATKKAQYNKLGTEACGSLNCYKYEEVDSENPEGKRVFWFDDKQFLLRKDEFAFGEFKTTNEYSYDNISIKAPSPTKDVPEGKNIYEYMYSGGADTTMPNTSDFQDFQQYQDSPTYEVPDASSYEESAPAE